MRFPLKVWLFALLLAIVTSIPYAIGAISAPEGGAYSGAAVVPDGAKVDYYSHMAKMWQGARGEWNYQLLFTHEAHAGLPTVQAFYVALGALSKLTPFDFTATYHLLRFILTMAMVLAIWAFAAHFLEDHSERWLVLFFGTIVVGWSWILFFLAPELVTQPERAPIELWLLDAYNLLGAFIMPHFAAAIILQIIAFLTFDKWLHQAKGRSIAILTIVLFLDAIIQPYVVLMTFPIFAILTFCHVFVLKTLKIKQALWLVIPAIAHGGIAIFQYLIIAGDPIWVNFTAQNKTLSPPPIYYILGYLPLLIPIAIGWRHIGSRIKSDDRWLLPLVWILVVIALLYAPFPTQRRYLLGLQTPLALFAALGWSRVILSRITESWRPFANIPYLTAGALALVLVLVGNGLSLMNPKTQPIAFYSAGDLSAGQWIRESTPPDALILTTFNGNGGKVLALTGHYVFLGHWIETVNFMEKLQEVSQFYDMATDDAWRQDFLISNGIDLVWYDDTVKAYGDWNPANADYLEQVFAQGDVALFAMKQDN